MAAPVISAASSILGFKRGETFEFNPAATNAPVRWTAVGLPPGVTIETHNQLAATGVHATDVITATAHGYQDGDAVYFVSLTGGSGLTAGTIYFVRDRATDTFKLAANAGGAEINFTTDISAAQVRKVSSGKISGSCAVQGVYVVTVSAINSANETGTREFVFGFSPEVAEEMQGFLDAIVLTVRLPEGTVSLAGASGGGTAAFSLKAGDVRLLVVRYEDGNGNRVDPEPVTMRFVCKEMEPDNVILEAAVFEKDGTGATAEFLLPVDLTESDLAGVLSNYEDDAGTLFQALAEIEWTRSITFDSSPLTLRASTPTFRVGIERDLAPN
jgi:hypothetical protein